MILGLRHPQQIATLTLHVPERRTYLIKKKYLTKFKLEAAQRWGIPKRCVTYVTTQGGSLRPWTLADSVFETVSLFLMLYFFLSGMGTINSAKEWVAWIGYILYMIADIVFLGLPEKVIGIAAPTAAQGLYPSVILQLVYISFSFGLVSSVSNRFRRSVLDDEIFHGTLANLADYLNGFDGEHLKETMVVDCGLAPEDTASKTGLEISGPEVMKSRDAENSKIVNSIEAQLRVIESEMRAAR